MNYKKIKKVTVFIGSPRKKTTYEVVQEFEKILKSYGEMEIDLEYILLKDYKLENCKSCLLCFNKGEEFCSLKDDRNVLLEKLENSDGIIIATPNHSFQVTALTKNFLDRLAFILHRPRFFNKTFMPIVTQGVFGGGSIVKYLETIGGNWGFDVVKGCCLTSLEPRTEFERKKMMKEIKKASARFYKQLIHSTPKAPSFFRIMLFRFTRSIMMVSLDEKYRDYRYFKENGWFESDYYYNTSLGLIKKLAGCFFDFLGKIMAKHRYRS